MTLLVDGSVCVRGCCSAPTNAAVFTSTFTSPTDEVGTALLDPGSMVMSKLAAEPPQLPSGLSTQPVRWIFRSLSLLVNLLPAKTNAAHALPLHDAVAPR